MNLRRYLLLFLWHGVFFVIAPFFLLLVVVPYCFHLIIPFFLYCLPVALLFPNHFRAHAAIWPENVLAWILLILFYLVLAIFSSFFHYCIRGEQENPAAGRFIIQRKRWVGAGIMWTINHMYRKNRRGSAGTEDEGYELLHAATKFEAQGRVQDALTAYQRVVDAHSHTAAALDAKKSIESLRAKIG